MSAIILAAVKALAGLSLVAMLIIVTACTAWRIVYYGFECRRAPIQKTAMLTAATLWIICAAIINFC